MPAHLCICTHHSFTQTIISRSFLVHFSFFEAFLYPISALTILIFPPATSSMTSTDTTKPSCGASEPSNANKIAAATACALSTKLRSAALLRLSVPRWM